VTRGDAWRRAAAAVACAFALHASGQAEEVARPDPAVEARLKALGEELRCLVCQNQTIADSAAPLAIDLRNQIREQVRAGRSDDQIRDYMVARYGDFVLYRPPLKGTTLLLWIGPFALLLAGIAIVVYIARSRRAGVGPAEVTAQRQREIATLLEDGRGPPPAR